MSAELPFLIVCGPQIEEIPDAAYLSRLRSSLIHDSDLRNLKQELLELHQIWPQLTATNPFLEQVSIAPLLRSVSEWISTGDSSILRSAGDTLRNTQLAILTVLAHILEYTTYLNHRQRQNQCGPELSVVDGVHNGGVQGLSIGLLSAITISCSQSKSDLAKYGAIAVRLALYAGAFVDLDVMQTQEPTICLDISWCGGEEKLDTVLENYRQVHMAIHKDVSSATIIVPRSSASSLVARLKEEGIDAKKSGLQGRFHFPGNSAAVHWQGVSKLCSSLPMFHFPDDCRPLVPLRRNDTAEIVADKASLHEMALRCILLEKADWYEVLTRSLAGINKESEEPQILMLGPAECIPSSVPAKLSRPMAPGQSLYVYPEDSIAIIGASCRGYGGEEKLFWGNYLSTAGAFDHAFFRKSPREATYMDPQHRLALHLAYEALESGGFFSPAFATQTDNVGCYVGVYSSDYEDNVNARSPTAFSFTGTARAFASGRISHFFGWTGPSLIVDTACSSSGVAIHMACRAILSGECTMALAGGVNLMTSPKSHQNLAAASLMSRSGQCKPFDSSADGYCRGEGGGFVLLKKLSSAVADNDRILGVLAASAINNSKGSLTITAPSLESQVALYRSVLRKAGMHPNEVSYVEAHGTGTQKGDPVECHSLQRVFGRSNKDSSPLRFGSVKGNIGHSEGASGVASLVKVLLMLQHGQIAPQASFSELNPEAPNLEEANMEIPLRIQPWDAAFRAACVNNYGAAGSNTAMIVCQPPAAWQSISPLSPTQNTTQYPFLITAHSEASLRQYCHALLQFVEDLHAVPEDELLASLAFHLAQRQNHQLGFRKAFSANSMIELKAHIGDEIVQKPESGSKPVVLVFAGQTGHRPRLSEEAYRSSFLLRYHLDRCDRALQSLGLHSLFPSIFGTQPLDDLVDLHCLLFSIQYATASAWIDAGLDVKKLVGHSLGQLTALCVARVLTLPDALKMISGRASLIKRKWGPESGCMLAMDSDAAAVQAIIDSTVGAEKVEIACYNAASSHVVVGTKDAITTVENAALSAGISTKRLAITHAFHSPMVDEILEDYEALLRELEFHPTAIPIEPCTKSSQAWENITPELVARQSREPVYFGEAVSRLEKELGSCIWLEAGSGPAGVTMVRRAATSSSHTFHYTRLGSPDAMASIADATLHLWRARVRVQCWTFHPWQRSCFRPLELPPYQFETTDHWLPFVNDHDAAAHHHHHHHQQQQQQQQVADAPPQLVSLVRSYGGADPETAEFSINQSSKEYSFLVRGRTVLGHTLSPPSVYLESVIRALSLLRTLPASPSAPLPQFEQIQLYAPLGFNPSRHLRLRLRRHTGSAWEFIIDSRAHDVDKDQAFQLQASGTIRFQEQGASLARQYLPLHRLIDHERCQTIREDPRASIVRGAFVKKILGRMVSYDDSYFGIRSIISKGLEAVGNVDMPTIASQHHFETRLNPPLLDNFLLVAEIHAGNLEEYTSDQMFVCNGLDEVVVHTSNHGNSQGPFTVYSKLERESDKVFVGDVFVLPEDQNTLSLALLGVKFSKVPIRSLQKALQAANGSSNMHEKVATDHSAITDEPHDPKITSMPIQPHESSSSDATSMISLLEVKGITESLIVETTGVLRETIKDDTLLGDFGVDSLMATELQARIQDVLHVELTIGKVCEQGMTFGRLCQEIHSRLNGMPQLTPDGNSVSESIPSSGQYPSEVREQEHIIMDIAKLLAEHLNCSPAIPPATPLSLLGLDSLLAIQLESEIESKFGKESSSVKVDENTTFSDLCQAIIGGNLSKPGEMRERKSFTNSPLETSKTSYFQHKGALKSEFDSVKQEYSVFARQTGFAGFYPDVYQRQQSLTVAYIVEALRNLGCDLTMLKAGEQLPSIPYAARYQKLALRYHQLLEDAGLISHSDDHPHTFLRTTKPLHQVGSADLHREILADFPAYRPDHLLLSATGPHLAECLSGNKDPLQLLFHSQDSRQLLEDFYVNSPMFSTATKMVCEVVGRLTRMTSSSGRLRILEIGAGTGATTQQLMDTLVASRATFTYTFTDISSSLVASARRKLEARYADARDRCAMEFAVLDIEQPPPARMLQSYDLVVASNVIHATKNLRESCANAQRLLRPDGGALCLLELTRPLAWLDCVFGLLDGWWRFSDGRTYPLVDERRWEACLLDAGFRHVDWTDDGSPESSLFRWILAMN